MKSLLIAIGNTWRRDDGAAACAVDRLGPLPDVDMRVQIQPTPELAADMEGLDLVVFVDADMRPGEACLEPLEPAPPAVAGVGHSVQAGEVLLLARELFDFAGRCYLCRIPGHDFGEGEGLAPETDRQVDRAVELLRTLLVG